MTARLVLPSSMSFSASYNYQLIMPDIYICLVFFATSTLALDHSFKK